MLPTTYAFIFVFGSIIGSFLNAVIWRLRTGETVAKGRSYCPSCGHTLKAHDLVPVFSFIVLRGKCRYCDEKIGSSYLLVEIAVGLMFTASAFVVISSGATLTADALPELLRNWYFISVLTVIFVYDFKYMLILRKVTTPAIILAVVANLALGMSPLSLIIGMVVGGGIFQIQRLLSDGKWVGGGDVWLGVVMGAMLGWPMVGVALFMAYMMGAAIGVILLSGKRVGWKSEVPFGTFLSFATVVTLLAGHEILGWYINTLL